MNDFLRRSFVAFCGLHGGRRNGSARESTDLAGDRWIGLEMLEARWLLNAQQIDPGFDLFSTDPVGTFIDIPNIGMVHFKGDPIGPGNTDTIVERFGPAVPGEPGESTVDIELVALSLVSVEPVVVDGKPFTVQLVGGRLLDPDNPSPPGMMEICEQSFFEGDFARGGDFTSDLPAEATLIFTAIGDPDSQFTQLFSDSLYGFGVWSDMTPPESQDPHNAMFPAGNFFPGVDPFDGSISPISEIAFSASHLLRPAELTRGAIEVDFFPTTLAEVTLVAPGGTEERVLLTGPTTVQVNFDGSIEGDATDDDGNQRDEVEAEIVNMDLVGNSSLGPVRMVTSAVRRSKGQIEETANLTVGTLDLPPFVNQGTADSFFDVFFEIDIGLNTFLNEIPKRMTSLITHKPPGRENIYEDLQTVPLVDIFSGENTGFFLGPMRHVPRPPIEVDVFPDSAAEITLISPEGTEEKIQLQGETIVHVFFEGENEGNAADDDDDGREEVTTQIVELNLTGTSPSLGPVTVQQNFSSPSFGQIEETGNLTNGTLDLPPFTSSGTADSFFDVFFEVEVGGNIFITDTPKRMRSLIRHKPPALGDVYEDPQIVPLLDLFGESTGFAIGPTRHIPNPRPGDLDVDGDVDFGDFSVLAANFTGTLAPDTGNKSPHEGDVDGDADVDFVDFSIFAANFTGTLAAPLLSPRDPGATAIHAESDRDAVPLSALAAAWRPIQTTRSGAAADLSSLYSPQHDWLPRSDHDDEHVNRLEILLSLSAPEL